MFRNQLSRLTPALLKMVETGANNRTALISIMDHKRDGTNRYPSARHALENLRERRTETMPKQRKILYSRDSACIQPLRQLMEEQAHRVLVAWALDCAARPLAFFEERIPAELRPREATIVSRMWAEGEIKMPLARRAILQAHAAAGEAGKRDAIAEAAARAVGHACATVHTETHALGLVFYWLTAVVRQCAPEERETRESEDLIWFMERLLYWRDHIEDWNAPWANFLLREAPNKEKLLHERKG